MKIRIKIKGKLYNIEILETQREKMKIKVQDKEFIFDCPTFSSASYEKKALLAENYLSQKKTFEIKEIKSPLACIISEIFIKEGQKIKKGQKIILLSAMKMENEIVSDIAGVIKEVKVKDGQQVKGEQTLIIIK